MGGAGGPSPPQGFCFCALHRNAKTPSPPALRAPLSPHREGGNRHLHSLLNQQIAKSNNHKPNGWSPSNKHTPPLPGWGWAGRIKRPGRGGVQLGLRRLSFVLPRRFLALDGPRPFCVPFLKWLPFKICTILFQCFLMRMDGPRFRPWRETILLLTG